ncbi:MAG: thiamine phosphate synthase, partial [Alphaproteobacteria bacterium]|nr:thiamine phosphate synthase [Alphaproteobacteria bacterium]
SKPGYGPALGMTTIENARKQTRLPIIALGGIDHHNAQACLKAGAHGIAVMGHIMRSPQPAQEIERLLQLTAI